jgi:hypothetical protein
MELGLSSQSTPFCKHGIFAPRLCRLTAQPAGSLSLKFQSRYRWQILLPAPDYPCSKPYPELITHQHLPARRIKEAFETGGCRKSYSKTIDGPRILRGESLT